MVRHVRTWGLLVALVAFGRSPSAHAQSTSAPAQAAPAASTTNVLFVMPAFDPEVQNQLREALLAQFAELGATLEFEPATPGAESLSQRVSRIQERASRHGAIAAFWIEDQPDGRWFVYMMDSQLERILVRPIEAQPERKASAIEAVAVMARESTHALMEGVPPPAAAVAAPTPPPPPPIAEKKYADQGPPASPPQAVESESELRRALRVSAAYAGTTFASSTPWQHGLSLGVSWMGFAPLYGGLAYVFTPSFDTKGQVTATEIITLEVARRPITAHAGFRYTQEQLSLDGQLGFTLEAVFRNKADIGATIPAATTTAQAEDTTWLYGFSPRVRVELRVFPSLGLYASGGIDVFLNPFRYVRLELETKKPFPLLDVNQVRPVAEVGVAFYP